MLMNENINMISCMNESCYVIRGDKGDVLIDTGREEYRDHIETWLMSYDIRLIILTHGHCSQIQNAGYFSRLYNAPVMISPYDMRIARDNGARPFYITNPLGHILKKQNDRIKHMHMNHFEPRIYAEEGMDLSPYGIDGVIIGLEGHTKGSIGILCRSCAGYDLYCGDAIMNVYSLPMFPMTAESPAKAKESIERIITLSPDRIMPGHGMPICCGDKAYRAFIDRF